MDSYCFTVGQFECTLIKDSAGPRSAASFITSVPQDELDRVIREQGFDPNALDFSTTPMLIKTPDKLVLVDTGDGGDKGNLRRCLRDLGVEAGAIDLVVITHGHGDHVAGILNADGTFAFPSARYIIWRSEWAYWSADERFTDTPDNPVRKVWDALKTNADRIDLIGGDQPEAEILPGVRAVAAPGHTVGHIALELSSNGEKLLHIADAAHAYFQFVRPEWSPKFDLDKAKSAETRRELFKRAARDGSLMTVYHFPFPGIGHVVEREGTFGWEQIGK